MKKIIILFGVSIALTLVACKGSCCKSEPANNNSSQTFNLDTLKLKSGDTFYQCSMDAEVLSNKPGKCPKCGMDLSEIKKK
ncbi:MAG: heavy metal-binding domain-containing protein [Saprospiraceae bacterium]